MSLSLVFPAYTLNKQLEEMAIRCVMSYREQGDEIIIVEDGGIFSPSLMGMATTYIYNAENKGFTANVNRGWRYATSDFVAIVSTDTMLRKGDLYDLCVPGKVTSPHIVNQYIDRLAGPFFVVPKEVAQERGMLLEQMRIYSSDSEYDARVADIFQKVPSVEIFHEMAQTVTAAGCEGGRQQQIDREAYQQLINEGKAAV